MNETSRKTISARISPRVASRAIFGCLIGAALLATAVPLPARAGDDDQQVPLDTKILRGIMESLGLRRDGDAINYQERAPLVIPPSHDLPPPERSDAAIAKNPAWPVDPDVKRRKLEAAQERNKLNAGEQILHDQSALRPDQMEPGPKPRTARRTDDGYRPSANGSGDPLPPSQLGSNGSIFGKMFGKDEPDVGRFTSEPPRTALTEPPAGYQTPSPDQPYGVSGKAPPPKATNYLELHGTVDGKN